MQSIYRIAILALGLAVAGCAKEPRAGAYATVSAQDQEVQTAIAYALQAKSKSLSSEAKAPVKVELVKVLKAEQQVVAGLNYHLQLKVKVNGTVKTADAVVWWQAWRKPAPYQLTSWDWK